MERRERVVLENMCMIRDGSKVLVEDKIGKDIRGMKGDEGRRLCVRRRIRTVYRESDRSILHAVMRTYKGM